MIVFLNPGAFIDDRNELVGCTPRRSASTEFPFRSTDLSIDGKTGSFSDGLPQDCIVDERTRLNSCCNSGERLRPPPFGSMPCLIDDFLLAQDLVSMLPD